MVWLGYQTPHFLPWKEHECTSMLTLQRQWLRCDGPYKRWLCEADHSCLCFSRCLELRSTRKRQMIRVWAHSMRRTRSNATPTSSFLALISQAADIPELPNLHGYWALWWRKRWNQIRRRQRGKEIWWAWWLWRGKLFLFVWSSTPALQTKTIFKLSN